MRDLYEKYGISVEEVAKWFTEKYGKLMPNISSQMKLELYMRYVKNTPFSQREIARSIELRGAPISVAKVAENIGKYSKIRVLVTEVSQNTEYEACRICNKSLKNCTCENSEPMTARFLSYKAGDETGEIVIKLPPSLADSEEDLTGKVVMVQGRVQEQDLSFLVSSVIKVYEEGDTIEVTPQEPADEIIRAGEKVEPKKEEVKVEKKKEEIKKQLGSNDEAKARQMIKLLVGRQILKSEFEKMMTEKFGKAFDVEAFEAKLLKDGLLQNEKDGKITLLSKK